MSTTTKHKLSNDAIFVIYANAATFFESRGWGTMAFSLRTALRRALPDDALAQVAAHTICLNFPEEGQLIAALRETTETVPVEGAKPEIPNYEGKFVFIEAGDPAYKFQNGEYFVVRQTPSSLYVAKLVGGYAGHNLVEKPLIGDKPWTVVKAWEDDVRAESGAREMIAWGNHSKEPGHKLRWIESVYSDCTENGQAVLRTLQGKQDAARGGCVIRGTELRRGTAYYFNYTDDAKLKEKTFFDAHGHAMNPERFLGADLLARVEALEKRENRLAELYREASELELQLKHRASVVRAMPPMHVRRLLSSGTAVTSYRRPHPVDDDTYKSLRKQIEGVFNQIRTIRSTPLSSPAGA